MPQGTEDNASVIAVGFHSRSALMSTNAEDLKGLQEKLGAGLRSHWKLFLLEGIVLALLGLAAILVPLAATVAVAVLLGWLILLSGIVGLATTFMMKGAPGFWWALASAVLAVVVGVMLLRSPLVGALSLTVILTAFLGVEGVVSILYGIEHRRESSGRSGMMLVSGVIDLLLAGMIFLDLPGSAVWAIGLLVGVNLLFGGSAMIGMALHARPAS
jgi:uncharacterized membrane protein HdeD (DUF308 family)